MAKEALSYRFGDFVLDVDNRQLWQGPNRVDLNGRYFDALGLLVREHGQLVARDQFFDEVWGDVVVSDAALAQCIKVVRKLLGDDAANPRFIQTVPRYGYRFIGPVEPLRPDPPAPPVEAMPRADARAAEVPSAHPPLAAAPLGVTPRPAAAPASGPAWVAPPLSSPAARPVAPGPASWPDALADGAAGTLGGGAAGVLGGLLYGLGLAAAPTEGGLGTASIVIVLVGLNVFVGLAGGFGVSVGMAVAGRGRRAGARIAGAAAGGMLVGGVARLLGLDAFHLLFGQAPAGITGGMEGAVLGGALALGAALGGGLDAAPRGRPVLGAGLAGAVAGVLIPLAGGRLMGGSLDLLARSFAGSRLHLDALGRFFGEVRFGYTTQVALGGLEGLFFGACVVGAIVGVRHLRRPGA